MKLFFLSLIIYGFLLTTIVLTKITFNSAQNKKQKLLAENTEKKEQEITLFVFILSAVENFELRQTQRRSGMLNNLPPNVSYKYIIGDKQCRVPTNLRATPYVCFGGGPTDEFDKRIEENDWKLIREMKKYGDILLVDMVDYYRALPKKVKIAFKWGLEHTTAKWFLKIDDDIFFNAEKIINGVSELNPDETILIGSISSGIGVPRTGKWGEKNYNKQTYPPFPLGSRGHITSRAFVSEIVNNSDQLFEYQGEDVSIGIWAHEFVSNATIIDRKDVMFTYPRCERGKTWVCGHDLKAVHYKRLLGS